MEKMSNSYLIGLQNAKCDENEVETLMPLTARREGLNEHLLG